MLRPLRIHPPQGFIAEETSTTWRMPASSGLRDPRSLQFQAPVRPNLLLTQRTIAEGTSLDELAAAACAELARHCEGLSAIETTRFEFRDGVEGRLLRYSLPVHQRFRVEQMQALRLDDSVCSTVTLSTESTRLDDDTLRAYLTCLAEVSLPSE